MHDSSLQADQPDYSMVLVPTVSFMSPGLTRRLNELSAQGINIICGPILPEITETGAPLGQWHQGITALKTAELADKLPGQMPTAEFSASNPEADMLILTATDGTRRIVLVNPADIPIRTLINGAEEFSLKFNHPARARTIPGRRVLELEPQSIVILEILEK